MKIVICYHFTQGLHNDALILKKVLERLYEIELCSYSEAELFHDTHKSNIYHNDIVVFLEHVHQKYIDNKRSLFFPNYEHLTKFDIQAMREFIDVICCKTLQTEKYLKKIKVDSRKLIYTGFISLDRQNSSFPKEFKFLHIKGVSNQKNTQILMNTWMEHPEWPQLTVVQQYDYELDKDLISNNITIIQRKLSEIEIKYLMNTHMFHISPSCFEGFGHTICEGLSCGSVVITTNNGPMNEIIDSKTGILIQPKLVHDTKLGVEANYFSQNCITCAIKSILKLDETEINNKSNEAILKYDVLKEKFKHNIHMIFKMICNDEV